MVRRSAATTGDMHTESDEALLYYMSCREDQTDRTLSDAATVEFHARHAAALHDRCKLICRQLGSVVDPEDLFSVTFTKAIEKAHTYRPESGTSSSTHRTLAWLCQIARNLLIDAIRNPHRSGPITGDRDTMAIEDYSTEEFAAMYCDGTNIARTARNIRLIQHGLETLDERTRRVITHTILHRQRSPKGSYVFRGEMTALARHLGTTPVNLRRIRSIGMKALATYVQKHTEGT